MEIMFFCPRWGSENLSWDKYCHKVKEAGYNGVEAGVSFDKSQLQLNQPALTITPGFGPAPYMMHRTVTKEPLVNQWKINYWMMEYLKEQLI